MAKQKKRLGGRLITILKFFKPRLPKYLKESFSEIRKVTWPTRKQSRRLTFSVAIFCIVFTIIAVVADYGFKIITERLFL